MPWIKKGLIYKPDGTHEWSQTHAQVPLAMKLGDDRLRVYFSTRDQHVRSYLSYVELDINNPQDVLKINDKPLIEFGRPGTFDENGTMPASWVEHDGKIYFYYQGWSPQVLSSYHICAGLSFSHDGGQTLEKYSDGPLLDRDTVDPIWSAMPCVRKEGDTFKAWYISCTEWINIDGRMEPLYLIKYAESKDGINWNKTGDICIDYKFEGEAIGRPWVIHHNGVYKMWYSSRGSVEYRSGTGEPYTMGYAESQDGIHWERKDDEVGMHISEDGWDSEMNCYSCVYEHKGDLYMLYNGNGFGASGFGYAVWQDEA